MFMAGRASPFSFVFSVFFTYESQRSLYSLPICPLLWFPFLVKEFFLNYDVGTNPLSLKYVAEVFSLTVTYLLNLFEILHNLKEILNQI